MYEWILVLMGYINKMVCWKLKALCSSRNRGKSKPKESGEDYSRRILEFLETAREEKLRKKKEVDNGTRWNVSAGVFYPAGEKEETGKNKGGGRR